VLFLEVVVISKKSGSIRPVCVKAVMDRFLLVPFVEEVIGMLRNIVRIGDALSFFFEDI
jgi:hypothetical protein